MGLKVEERETNGDPMEKRKQVETERMLLEKREKDGTKVRGPLRYSYRRPEAVSTALRSLRSKIFRLLPLSRIL